MNLIQINESAGRDYRTVALPVCLHNTVFNEPLVPEGGASVCHIPVRCGVYSMGHRGRGL
jgi:hypothetical protein